jgi:hypothetical protein
MRTSRLFRRPVVAGAALVFACVTLRAQLPSGQDLLGDPFTGPATSAPVITLNITGSEAYPCLTAGPAVPPGGPTTIQNCGLATPDPDGQGALRLTGVGEQEASAIVYNTNLPTAQGLTITFKQYQWGGDGIGGPTGADGISFFLAVAPPQPTTIGPPGGALGYVSYFGANGMPGGWLGVGLDAWGNFSNEVFASDTSCAVPAWAGFRPNEIVVRGPGHETNGYCLLSSSFELGNDNPVGQFGAQLSGPDRASSERTIQVIIDPAAGTYTVNIDPAGGSNFVLATSGPLPSSYYDPVTGAVVPGIPPRITFGFAAATGSATDIHEITSLSTTTTNGDVPVLGLSKSNSLAGTALAGSVFDYVLTPRVDGTVPEAEPLTIRVTDTLPPGVAFNGTPSGPSWSCQTTSSSAFACDYTDATPIDPGTTLPDITAPVILDAGLAAGTTIVNTATVTSADAALPVSAANTVVIGVAPPPVSITTVTLAGGIVGTAYTDGLDATGGTGAFTWSLDSGSLPAGLALASTTGAITGSPSAAGLVNFTVRATDGAGAFATQALSINIAPLPVSITTVSLAGGMVGTAYTDALAATGGTGAFTWSLDSGSLPAGLALASTTGAITGSPSAAGLVNFTVRATDGAGAFATQALSINIAPLPVSITTSSLAGGTVNVGYNAMLAATGGTGAFTWSLESGALPAGLALAANGAITGTPTAPGLANFVVRATAGTFATKAFSITIAPASSSPLAITTTSLPNGRVGAPYTANVLATGGRPPYTWRVATGQLPAGLSLSTAGVISGTPTRLESFDRSFEVRVTDQANRSVTRRFQILVSNLKITTTSLPALQVGSDPWVRIETSGSIGITTMALVSGTLPAGMKLLQNGGGGVLYESPTAAGTFTFTLRATDFTGATDSRTFTIRIIPDIDIIPVDPIRMSRGRPFSYQLQARTVGGPPSLPYTWSITMGTLPAGLSLSPSGLITGTPTQFGGALVFVRVTDALGAVANGGIFLFVGF